MNFSSINEYFYKLQSRYYAWLLLPLMMILIFYVVSSVGKNVVNVDSQLHLLLRALLPTIAFIELTTVHLVLNSRVKKISRLPALVDRLDQFVQITFIRAIVGTSASITILIGLFLTGDQWFTIAFFICLFLIYLQRPSPNNFVRQMQLKGDERELILKGELK